MVLPHALHFSAYEKRVEAETCDFGFTLTGMKLTGHQVKPAGSGLTDFSSGSLLSVGLQDNAKISVQHPDQSKPRLVSLIG